VTTLRSARASDVWLRGILSSLYRIRPATRADVGRHARLNNASVSRGLNQLIDAGIIRKLGELESGGGRPRDLLAINPDAAGFVAVDLEGIAVRFAHTDFLGGIRRRWEAAVPLGHFFPVDKVFEGIDIVLRDATPGERDRVQAIGVSFPGLMTKEGLLTAVNLGWRDVPLERLLRDRFRLPVFLERDEGTSIRAERSHGRAKEARNWIYLIVSNGVGVGLVVDGRHVAGHTHMSGELGHVTIDSNLDVRCQCGKYGCLETVASTPAIVQYYGDLTGHPPASLAEISLSHIFELARRGDPAAVTTVERAGRALGLALSHAVNLLNPELILLGGDIVAGQDVLTPLLRKELGRHVLPHLARVVEIAASDLGPDVRLRGAASLAFHGCLAEPHLLARLCKLPEST
jgi:N-acetylglucosamine repressor